MSYAEDFEDEGEYFAEQDEIERMYEIRADIEEDRNNRMYALIGKYIISCDGKKDKIYLQDKRISNKKYWTKFLNNAIGFSTKEGALQEVKKFKYNHPMVNLVDRNFKLIPIS